MMYADLVDFDDLVARLAELGVEAPSQAGPAELKTALGDWLAQADDQQRGAFVALADALEQGSSGLVLPAVLELLNEMRQQFT